MQLLYPLNEFLFVRVVSIGFSSLTAARLGLHSFSGLIDDVRIYDVALSAEKIEAIAH